MRRYSKVADCCSCGGVAITTVGDCLAVFSKAGYAGSSVPAYPLYVKSQSSKSLPRCLRLWLPDSHVLWARFRSHGFRESCHRCVHRSARRLVTNFNHLCSELIELTSQHLNFLSRCHRHSISQYRNTGNRSISQFQEYRLRYHAVRCALWMIRAVFTIYDLDPKTSECEKHVSVKSTVTGCDVTHCATTLQGFNKHLFAHSVVLVSRAQGRTPFICTGLHVIFECTKLWNCLH